MLIFLYFFVGVGGGFKMFAIFVSGSIKHPTIRLHSTILLFYLLIFFHRAYTNNLIFIMLCIEALVYTDAFIVHTFF